jgi:hypothetical protein
MSPKECSASGIQTQFLINQDTGNNNRSQQISQLRTNYRNGSTEDCSCSRWQQSHQLRNLQGAPPIQEALLYSYGQPLSR